MLPQLMRAGGSPGGARPKVLVGFNPAKNEMVSGEDDLPEGFEHWLVKFSAKTDMAHNRDDHAKNFSFLLDDSNGKWGLSPAYDLTFSHGPGGEHSTTVAGEGSQPTRKQCIDLAVRYDIGTSRAASIFAEIADAVSRWPEFAQSAGLDEEAMEQIGRHQKLGTKLPG